MLYRSRRLLKGVFLMTSLSLAECCRLLAIDPKTLRQWVVQAQMALHTDPTNAKIKCLQVEQVQSLAHLHGRVLKPEASASAVSLRMSEAQSQGLPTALPDTDLRARLAQLEVQVATLQTQLTDLSLQLLREREQRLLVLEAQCFKAGEPLSPPSACPVSFKPAKPSGARHAPRQQTHLIPLIEYGARGQYVLICPQQGEQHIVPDSPEWFAWLATFHSFRFIGRQGRLSTYRNPGRSCWMAYRRIHGHHYEYALGHTERLTIERLEQMAATLQSHAPVL
jgi:hypothetical protein